jgi:hypothetical protein
MKKTAAASSITVVGLALIGIATPLGANLWSFATGQGFFIPDESSVFSFRVTKMNEGSGEWWLYGRDDEHLFALHPSEPTYLSAALASQAACASFKADDFTSWCSSEQHPVPEQ